MVLLHFISLCLEFCLFNIGIYLESIICDLGFFSNIIIDGSIKMIKPIHQHTIHILCFLSNP
jgi:hypothetical protein